MSRSRDFADLAGSADAGGLTGRNIVTNGAMTVAQRSTSETNFTGFAYRTVDRVKSNLSGGGSLDQEQSTDVPSGQGFINSLKTTVNTVDSSIAAGDYYGLEFPLEGQNVNGVSGFGTSGAKNLTLSFWIKSSVTGDYSVSFQNGVFDTSYVSKYTISSANTWEKKTISITAKTDGTWVTTNARGARIWFSLGTGSDFTTSNEQTWESALYVHITGTTQWISNASATFYLTGVQLEVGDTATPFEHEDYGTTLRKCARYYYKINTNSSGNTYAMGGMSITTTTFHALSNMAEMRTAPTALETNGTAGDYRVVRGGLGSAAVCNAVPTLAFAGTNSANCYATVASGLSSSSAGSLQLNSTTAFLAWSAEL